MPINKGIAINKGNPKNCHFRVRSPSRAFLMQKKQHPFRMLFFALNEPNPGLEGSKSRLPARSLLLQSRVIHRMTATRLALFIKKNLKGCCFFVFIGRKPATKQMRKHLRVVRLRVLFFALNERRSCARRFEVSPTGSVVAPALNGIFSFFK